MVGSIIHSKLLMDYNGLNTYCTRLMECKQRLFEMFLWIVGRYLVFPNLSNESQIKICLFTSKHVYKADKVVFLPV